MTKGGSHNIVDYSADSKDNAQLVSGALSDVERLMSSYTQLLRFDLQTELQKVGKTVVGGVFATMIVNTGLLLLVMAFARVLHANLQWSLTASYAGVGCLMFSLGIIMAIGGWYLFRGPRMPRVVDDASKDAQWIQDNI